MRFKVVERSHCFAWRKVGDLQIFGTSIYLEAVSGLWEDVFSWVCLGERPKWAIEEEEDGEALEPAASA